MSARESFRGSLVLSMGWGFQRPVYFIHFPVLGASSPVTQRKKSHRSGGGHLSSGGTGGILQLPPSKGHPLPSRGEKSHRSGRGHPPSGEAEGPPKFRKNRSQNTTNPNEKNRGPYGRFQRGTLWSLERGIKGRKPSKGFLPCESLPPFFSEERRCPRGMSARESFRGSLILSMG